MKTINYLKTYYFLYFKDYKYIFLGIFSFPIILMLIIHGLIFDIKNILLK
jgi:hypothetical protein